MNTDISGYGTGRNALSYASEHGQTTVVSYLLEQKADPNTRDSHGLHPLLYASWRGNKPVAEKLVHSSQFHHFKVLHPLN